MPARRRATANRDRRIPAGARKTAVALTIWSIPETINHLRIRRPEPKEEHDEASHSLPFGDLHGSLLFGHCASTGRGQNRKLAADSDSAAADFQTAAAQTH